MVKKILLGNFKGPRGETGPQGIQGPQGAKGEKGEKGDSGRDGADGVTETPTSILEKLRTVDGPGSGLDADTIDGEHSNTYASAEETLTQLDDLKNTRLVIGRSKDYTGEEDIRFKVERGESIYARIISSNPDINTGAGVKIAFILGDKTIYTRTTDVNGRASLEINLFDGVYQFYCVVPHKGAGDNPRLLQHKILVVGNSASVGGETV